MFDFLANKIDLGKSSILRDRPASLGKAPYPLSTMAVAALRAALETERSSLQQIDANIKRMVQSPGRPAHHERFGAETLKRRLETKTAFSRLSARPDFEDEEGGMKRPRISSQVTRDLPSKQEVMKAQCGDEQSKVRNRRMFGSLLGTLQKFKQEEIVLKTKEDKRAQVERRIEEQAQQEKEQHKRERQTLFAEREQKKSRIKALEAKVARASEFEVWVASHSKLCNFILTRAEPSLYWLPRVMDARAEKQLAASREAHEKKLEKKRRELEEELVRIEERCMRPHPARAAKENERANHDVVETNDHKQSEDGSTDPPHQTRDKFASDANGDKMDDGDDDKMDDADNTISDGVAKMDDTRQSHGDERQSSPEPEDAQDSESHEEPPPPGVDSPMEETEAADGDHMPES